MKCFICGEEINPAGSWFERKQPGEPVKYEHRPHCPNPKPASKGDPAP